MEVSHKSTIDLSVAWKGSNTVYYDKGKSIEVGGYTVGVSHSYIGNIEFCLNSKKQLFKEAAQTKDQFLESYFDPQKFLFPQDDQMIVRLFVPLDRNLEPEKVHRVSFKTSERSMHSFFPKPGKRKSVTVTADQVHDIFMEGFKYTPYIHPCVQPQSRIWGEKITIAYSPPENLKMGEKYTLVFQSDENLSNITATLEKDPFQLDTTCITSMTESLSISDKTPIANEFISNLRKVFSADNKTRFSSSDEKVDAPRVSVKPLNDSEQLSVSVKPLNDSEQLIFFEVPEKTIWVDEDARTDYASSQNIATLVKELKEKGPLIGISVKIGPHSYVKKPFKLKSKICGREIFAFEKDSKRADCAPRCVIVIGADQEKEHVYYTLATKVTANRQDFLREYKHSMMDENIYVVSHANFRNHLFDLFPQLPENQAFRKKIPVSFEARCPSLTIKEKEYLNKLLALPFSLILDQNEVEKKCKAIGQEIFDTFKKMGGGSSGGGKYSMKVICDAIPFYAEDGSLRKKYIERAWNNVGDQNWTWRS